MRLGQGFWFPWIVFQRFHRMKLDFCWQREMFQLLQNTLIEHWNFFWFWSIGKKGEKGNTHSNVWKLCIPSHRKEKNKDKQINGTICFRIELKLKLCIQNVVCWFSLSFPQNNTHTRSFTSISWKKTRSSTNRKNSNLNQYEVDRSRITLNNLC